LADLGAEVIKVEPPDGDLTRLMVPRIGGMSVYYVQYNAGKRCVSIDLTRDEGRELLLRMVERADIVLENYRSDVLGRLGLGYDVLSARNPRIILASISGWGHGNSRSRQGAFAVTIHAEAGLTATVARTRGDEVPRNDPLAHADVYGGLHALAALLAALHQRHRTGRGQAVEVSMAESMLTAHDIASVELSGRDPDEGFRAGQHRTPIYRLATGRAVCVGLDPTTVGGFDVWCRAMDRSDLTCDPRFATPGDRQRNRSDLDEVLGSWVATFDTAAELESAMGDSSVLAAEVRSVAELAGTPWASERGALVDVALDGGEVVRVPQSPWRFSDAEGGVRPVVGFRGQHNREVLRDLLGLGNEELDALETSGVLSDRVPR
jgi:crotonobetainyl-CoA:carnitine CoA-transferase CaiB-like acyl-CoA transferase